jgi:hypothetical protein
LQASEAPYCVGVKNVLVVTWFTRTKWYLGLPNGFDALDEVLVDACAAPGLELPQASMTRPNIGIPAPTTAALRMKRRRDCS